MQRSEKRFNVFFKKLFLKTSKICTKYTHFKKSFLKKTLRRFSDLYIPIYAFLVNIMIMFYVPHIQRNRLVTIRTSDDTSKVFSHRRKSFSRFSSKETWIQLKSMSEFEQFLTCPVTSKSSREVKNGRKFILKNVKDSRDIGYSNAH